MNRNNLRVQDAQRGEIEAIYFLRTQDAKTIQPFVGADTSVGMEYELQVAVEGTHENVDLPRTIVASNYYKNLVKRALRGDLPSSLVNDLDDFLYKNHGNIWENSWVRFEKRFLAPQVLSILTNDLLADKSKPSGENRGDEQQFYCTHHNKEMLRLPISYVLKLSLANIINNEKSLPPEIEKCGLDLFPHLLSDNTSPEILSFTIPRANKGKASIGRQAAAETARTFLLCQLLIQYANKHFELEKTGQRSMIYFAPHAPSRQKRLNELVPDGFYRHLFMSPCLSGWDRGEEKSQYMGLCHKTLSRSQLNTIGKLKDAGILTNNLITLPNTSNTCLANNGTHVSLGSRILSDLARHQKWGFSPNVEKYFGDLVIKIVEHFLPLLVGTYSAAPYRINFRDFHPENVLGFLPHELDYTHLRMIWRRWKKKAKIGFMGRAITPFGPRWFDNILASTLRLKGDFVPDFRLIDYLVALMSTDSSPGLNGISGNHEQLKEELMEMGVFDNRMSIYLLYRQRLMASSGYSGFEGRSYSLFHSFKEDMAEAIDLQNLITALAYRYILDEKIRHNDIPDTPSVESERRQIFFGTAIGIPTFYVRYDTDNQFLQKILSFVQHSRRSNRYRGYLRVKNSEYKLALLKILRQDGAGLIKKLKASDCLLSLEEKLSGRAATANQKIIDGMRQLQHHRKGPFALSAEAFNAGTEKYYREELKQLQMKEGLEVLNNNLNLLENNSETNLKEIAQKIATDSGTADYLSEVKDEIINETAATDTIKNVIFLCLAAINHEQKNS